MHSCGCKGNVQHSILLYDVFAGVTNAPTAGFGSVFRPYYPSVLTLIRSFVVDSLHDKRRSGRALAFFTATFETIVRRVLITPFSVSPSHRVGELVDDLVEERNGDTPSVSPDIALHLTRELGSSPWLRTLDLHFKTGIHSILCDRADGM